MVHHCAVQRKPALCTMAKEQHGGEYGRHNMKVSPSVCILTKTQPANEMKRLKMIDMLKGRGFKKIFLLAPLAPKTFSRAGALSFGHGSIASCSTVSLSLGRLTYKARTPPPSRTHTCHPCPRLPLTQCSHAIHALCLEARGICCLGTIYLCLQLQERLRSPDSMQSPFPLTRNGSYSPAVIVGLPMCQQLW